MFVWKTVSGVCNGMVFRGEAWATVWCPSLAFTSPGSAAAAPAKLLAGSAWRSLWFAAAPTTPWAARSV